MYTSKRLFRFSLDFQHPNNYRLRVSRVEYEDAGYYHCQLATHPPSLVWTRLDLLRPVFSMSSQDLHYHRGSQIKLRCEVSRGPLYSSSLEWRVTRDGR